ncbi:MAG: GAF domain-containing protein [Desulfobacteraceae bacterium]|nr:MAG: GAF domain-containing protein [Desulfobacteraceae bacterium]
MSENQTILNALLKISRISNQKQKDFQTKLHLIIHEIAGCMNTGRASIILKKGNKYLEVAASTIPGLVGHKIPIDGESPSAWVIKNKKTLYVKDHDDKNHPCNRFDNYRKDAFLIAPVLVDNRAVGVISITEKIGTDLFSQEEQEGFVLIASQILGALENHRLTESLRKSKHELKKKNTELQKLEKLRTELFNMLVHDLKGPISEVIANLDILTYTVKDEENLDYINSAQSASDTLYRMVADLLDIARLEEGKVPIVAEKLKPDDLIVEAVSRIHGLAGIKKINLVPQVNADTGKINIEGDRELLMRVLQNLLTNAIDHSPSGETIKLGCRYTDGEFLQIYVLDNGPGVPPEYKEAIFEKYIQVSKKRDGRTYTTGLGLTFCKLAVEAHQGKIYVESDGKKGSCFTFLLPISP